MKLPNIEDLEHISRKSDFYVNKDIATTEAILKKLLENIEAFKKIEQDNKVLRRKLLENQSMLKTEFYDKLDEINKTVQRKEELYEYKHKSILKQHEEIKLELNKRLFSEKSKNKILKEHYSRLYNTFKEVHNDNLKLRRLNATILRKVALLSRKSFANEKLLDKRTELIKQDFDNKLRNFGKEQLSKEIEYKSRIESLETDLKSYYEELRKAKTKYYLREKELKEKLKDLLS